MSVEEVLERIKGGKIVGYTLDRGDIVLLVEKNGRVQRVRFSAYYDLELPLHTDLDECDLPDYLYVDVELE